MKAKKLASNQKYISTAQVIIPGFETPFTKELNPNNRWMKLSYLVPWDEIVGLYEKTLKKHTGRPAINGRIVMGAMIIKHYCGFTDEDTILNIQENFYMQYFLGFSSHHPNPVFDPSLFVEIRERLGIETINSMNEAVVSYAKMNQTKEGTRPTAGLKTDNSSKDTPHNLTDTFEEPIDSILPEEQTTITLVENKGRMLIDATAAPQNIAYPTDLNLLNDCRKKTELIIDKLWEQLCENTILGCLRLLDKPRTYRENARKDYLQTAQSKKKTSPKVRKAIGKQLGYVRRNLATIDMMLGPNTQPFPLSYNLQRYLWIIKTCYAQQHEMYEKRTHKIENRIVSIHQPHVRPIVRGKANAKVEFGSKINVSLVDGMSFLDKLSWDAFNEGTKLLESVELYRKRHGYYPKEVLGDQIYCTRENRRELKLLGITLIAKPLGRPKAVPEVHVSPGERNPIEGKFGQAKRAYGMDNIQAKLKVTSEAWIAMIVLVLNLVKLAGRVPLWIKTKIVQFYINCIFLRLNLAS